MPARLFNIRTSRSPSAPAACPCMDDLHPYSLKDHNPSYVSLASRGPTTTPVASGPKLSNHPLCGKIQVTGCDVVDLGRTTRGPATFTPRSAVYLLPGESWSHIRGSADCPYLDELPTCISPRCIIGLSSHDAFSFKQDPPQPLHLHYTPLNAGRCGVMNWDARMVTAGNPGSSCRF